MNTTITKKIKGVLVILFACSCFASFAQTNIIEKTSEDEEALTDSACGGTERWAQKVLTDALASTVNFAPIQSNVASLVALTTPFPSPYMARQAGTEDKTYQISCNITIKKEETDNDYHLVLSDGSHTLIGEIPNPVCTTAVASAHSIQYQTARNFIDAHIATGNVFNVNIGMVTITGVAFVDPPHAQTGAAPNNLELHPILDIHFATSTAPPTANFIATANGCIGQPIALTDNSSNSPTSWSWTMTGGSPASSSIQNPSVTYNSVGTYTVKLISTNSHGSSSQVTKTIIVNISPPVPTITLSGNILTSSSTTGNQWYYNGSLLNGVTGQSYTATVSGPYYVVVTNSGGCSKSSATFNFTSTGIASIANIGVLTIVPNPTNGNVTLNFADKSEHLTIEVFNELGQLIYTEKVNDCPKDFNKTIDISAFKTGIYLFKIVTNETVFLKKIVLLK